MLCPVCNIEMIVVEYKRIELDHCLNCQGVWFDSQELELLLATTGTQTIPLVAAPESTEAKRRCPLCRKKMDKVFTGKGNPVLIDSCTQGEGLWFDGGEIVALLSHLYVSKTDDSLRAFLGEVFQSSTTQGK